MDFASDARPFVSGDNRFLLRHQPKNSNNL